MITYNNGIHESRVRLEVDLGKIRSNVKKIRSAVAPCGVTAVLKANAYGLGVRKVAEACMDAGADSFGVAELNEALRLIDMDVPVMILGNVLPDEISPAIAAGVILPVNDFAMAERISKEALRQHKTARCQFLVDTGMGRLGVLSGEAAEVILKVSRLSNLDCFGIYSHFPVAYQGEDAYTIKQIEKFKLLLAELDKSGLGFKRIHMANSDAVNNFPQSCMAPFNGVRTGLNIYGFFDNDVRQSLQLEPVISLKTRLAAVRRLPAGACIGYGRTHKLLKDTLVGTIAAGYADGLPLALSNRGYVLIRGQLCPVLGRVSMDYTTVALDVIPEAQCGDEVICIGTQGEASIPLSNWAQLKGTHPYELLCAMGSRVERVYYNS
ncbi:alanine racemase [Lentisphaerota bacterium ZTH]|nr:alanine racemase [Lentisphaerota bacterium]WET06227.1 alanine racemase [Lentisphaerota bacterium ZTH]